MGVEASPGAELPHVVMGAVRTAAPDAASPARMPCTPHTHAVRAFPVGWACFQAGRARNPGSATARRQGSQASKKPGTRAARQTDTRKIHCKGKFLLKGLIIQGEIPHKREIPYKRKSLIRADGPSRASRVVSVDAEPEATPKNINNY